MYESFTTPMQSEQFASMNQFSFTSKMGTDYFDGIGSLYCQTTARYVASTFDYTEFNSFFKDTYVEHIYSQVCQLAENLGIRIGRVRFLRLKAKTCYSLHVDPDEFRFHIPLRTSGKSFFIVANKVYRMPSVGSLYVLKTSEEHTAVNASFEDRDHMVFDTYSPKQ